MLALQLSELESDKIIKKRVYPVGTAPCQGNTLEI